MKKGVPGHGAVSIILVFTVLCLSMFSVITFTQAKSDKALANAAASMSLGYYEADTAAERILAALRSKRHESGHILGVDVTVTDMGDSDAVSFSIPVTENKELAVEARISEGMCEILVWKMRDTDTWVPDLEHPLFFDFDFDF